MELNKKAGVQFPLRAMSAAFLLTLATSASAAPGTLSDVPLYTRGSAEPNIMFLLDSSGSMYEVVLPPEDYDPAENIPCANPIDKNRKNYNNYYTVNYRVNKYSGKVEFSIESYKNGDWQTWNSVNNCFDNNTNFAVRFYADGNSSSYYRTGDYQTYSYLNLYDDGSNGARPRQSGHFLNWFFSTKTAAGTYTADKFLEEDGKTARRIKLGVGRRTDIMKSAAAELVSGLENVRVGLMDFNAGDGARALSGLTSITDDSREDLLEAIDKISASGGTPLAESFQDIGRYFISGYESQKLSYVDKNGDAKEAQGDVIFSSQPHWNGVPIPQTGVENGAIQYYCQKSFMVALTDGEPSVDDNVSSILKKYDTPCEGPEGCTHGDDESMDDVIKALYEIDLRPDLKEPDGTPVKNNITSYLIGFASQGLSDTDVMVNAGALGGGGVYSADNASQLKTTFNQIISKVNAIVGSSSAVSFNSTSLESDTALFAAKFDSGNWSGELAAYSIDSDGKISSTPVWEAGAKLDALSYISQRFMLTYRADLDKNNDGVAEGGGVLFTADSAGLDVANADTVSEQDLNINTSTGVAVTDSRAVERIAYLRGDRSNEGAAEDEFRQRVSRLGDIINSSPVYVAKPDAGWETEKFPEASSYSAFKSAKSSRTPVVYVGTNDGFLHGFNASTTGSDGGKELIAYSPSALASTEDEKGLHALTSQIYQHKYYVDGTPTVTDAYIDGAWKTVLVGGLGAGGKGYYALDVTEPANFIAANASSLVMWEFTDSDNNNLGYTFSRPQIGRLSNGEWAAIFGNGYNSTTGDAGLFIVYLDGNDGQGNNYVYISTGVGSSMDKNGLSTPAIVDADLDGTIDRVYAGDLKGNMWAFDLSKTGSWDVIKDASNNPKPLFSTGGEPITAAPLVAKNVVYSHGSTPNLLVYFGSGQYLTEVDTADTSAGGFYAVSDNGKYGLSKTDLEIRTLVNQDVTQADGSVKTLRKATGSAVDWSSKSGWYMQLKTGVTPDGGERVVTRPTLIDEVLFFNTMIPTGQVCSAGGYGWLMSVDFRTGLAPTDFAVFDTNGDGEINSDDQGLIGEMVTSGMPNESGFIKGSGVVWQYTGDTSGSTSGRPTETGGGSSAGRLSWEEITPN
ncbi:PilC/PilY family type IV pilus protein [Microbulbifer thermotolerans]|uniref:PilC/PilY family type IV pilus protein n=1 Tax=Microbulbifer thermotolerans TaxID=252514 RepID=UPI0026739F79|nr:PilC/PilY family type IV pilus protein [Microbulbifer thermotolerans]WKT61135.1 PilC/PilY family type IV pilus protein [Microbulbifer thermotolerans]